MIKTITLISLLFLLSSGLIFCQSVFIDKYLTDPLTYTVIGTSTNQVSLPRDLDFKPGTDELWVLNMGTTTGSSHVIFYNAGMTNQTSQYRKDTHTSHFLRVSSAFAFGDNGQWGGVSEIQNTNSSSPTFMGPSLWLADTTIYARVFQNNWVSGLPLGSHIDMLHQSPFAMGIAHDSAMVYWVMDGYNGNICKYDFVQDHGPGYDNHSAGKIWRYTDVPVTRVVGVPSHMVLDKANHWLYFIDGGSKTINRLNTNTGTVTGNLTVPSSASEPLASYKKVEGATVEIIDTLIGQPCGIDYYNNRLVVTDYDLGNIYFYSTAGVPTLLGTIQTGHINNMGVKIGPDGKIWFVNKTENKVYRIDPTPPTLDAAIKSITSPMVENTTKNYFSSSFDICSGTITPSVDIINNGTTTITDMEIHYMIDGGPHTVYNWTGSLTTGSTVSVTLPISVISNGAHQLDAMVMMVNGMADDVEQNNSASGSFRSFDALQVLPFTESFSATAFPPANWNYVHFNPTCKMSRVTTGGFGASTGGMKMDNYSGNMDVTGQKDFFMSPRIDFTNANATAALTFSVAHARYNTTTSDRLQVAASTDCGTTWTTVYDKAGAVLASALTTTAAFTPTATQWRHDTVSLASYAGQAEVMLMFTSISNYGNNFYVDDIFVGDISTGISENVFSNSFNVYPNPASDVLNISFMGNATNDKAVIKITDIAGKEMYSSGEVSLLNNQAKAIQLKNLGLAKGMYFLTLSQGSSRASKKIVIQ